MFQTFINSYPISGKQTANKFMSWQSLAALAYKEFSVSQKQKVLVDIKLNSTLKKKWKKKSHLVIHSPSQLPR